MSFGFTTTEITSLNALGKRLIRDAGASPSTDYVCQEFYDIGMELLILSTELQNHSQRLQSGYANFKSNMQHQGLSELELQEKYRELLIDNIFEYKALRNAQGHVIKTVKRYDHLVENCANLTRYPLTSDYLMGVIRGFCRIFDEIFTCIYRTFCDPTAQTQVHIKEESKLESYKNVGNFHNKPLTKGKYERAKYPSLLSVGLPNYDNLASPGTKDPAAIASAKNMEKAMRPYFFNLSYKSQLRDLVEKTAHEQLDTLKEDAKGCCGLG